ncbi:MAG: DUF3108 domain-containing protein [Candidatus Zixiibacteriota bacterium]
MTRPRSIKWAVIVAALAATIPAIYLVTATGGMADSDSSQPGGEANASSIDRFIENVAFGVGERMTFDINYGFINAGSASLEVAKLIEYQGRPCYQVVSRAQSNSFFSSFYRVEDRVESIVDAVGVYSWRFEKNLREGNYRADRMYAFDQINRAVHYEKDTLPVEPYVQDALSALYFVRTQPLEVGKSIFVDNFVDGKKYRMEVRVLKKERIKVAAGSFDCIVVEPLTQSVGVFKNEGTLTVWLTDDRLRMPVLMKSKILVGSVSAELTDYHLGDIREF